MKKIIYGLLIVTAAGLLWYLFINPTDYTINFKAKATAGTINQTLKLWDHNLTKTRSIHKIEDIIQGQDPKHLTQIFKFNDSIHTYNWRIGDTTDSITEISVYIRDTKHSFMNKLKIPFLYTDFEKRSEKTVLDFMKNLKEHTNNIKVSIIGKESIPEKYMAYIPIKSKQFEKADGMMRNFSYLTNELANSGVTLDGHPMIEITYWNQQNDSIHYNFGQPIIKSDSLPKIQDIKYKQINTKPAIKAEYNGNYITSDRAWYALLEHAKSNNIQIESKPIEVFHNNPNVGSDVLNWKTEVYLPIAN
ncbi:AraC family transcriptional regulator [Aurantibacter crassamenti]|uniref:AraC family transcriptional regulator n=1 Tax=Aurantibacter crassamenti TaxID=1837375 RepID=UPI001939E57A|nr:AraC family transcriptional regulator [Aurantibacter crassamenti]MBM1104757.1 AraC family transcriptional regulator [Aurantibacter crassamenti]